MTSAVAVLCDPLNPEDTATRLQEVLGQGQWVRLLGRESSADPALLHPKAVGWPEGPGLVLSTGGSTGGRSLCLHPVGNLERSAQATAQWLRCISIDPTTALVWNPLPFHHVSGFMPWWRARQWNAAHRWLASE
ncbi:O-succinylbenzoic acid--CoA ligase, partial [Legionella pneumophila]